jgi:hypothetical protein
MEGAMKSTLAIALVVLWLMAGCSLFIPKECRYLKVAQNRATGEEVQQKLGAPLERIAVPTGERLWRYEVLEEQPTHRGTPTGFWCDEYRLTFDREGVLRDWTHRSFFHGGELRPEPCQAGYERLAL